MAVRTRHRACLACVDGGKLLCIEQRDPVTAKRFWSVPGGAVEPDESPLEAAVRETREETGYRVQAVADSEIVTEYPFLWGGHRIDCTTHWFLGRLAERAPGPVAGDQHVTAVMWVSLTEVSRLLSTHPGIRDTVLQLLARA